MQDGEEDEEQEEQEIDPTVNRAIHRILLQDIRHWPRTACCPLRTPSPLPPRLTLFRA